MESLLIDPNATIKSALEKLNLASEKCLMIVGNNNKLLGTITDGDLRKSILKGLSFNESIISIYNSNPTYVLEDSYNETDIRSIFLEKKFDLIPVINRDGIVVNYVAWKEVFEDEESKHMRSLDVPVVIMSGGKGTRLEPFTKVLPKPLVPIHEKPIIEHIIERFTDVGVNQFVLTINYKARIMKAFFEELNPDYTVDFIIEKEPLGTAGSLKFLEEKFDSPFLVTNCDIIIKTDYPKLYEFHQKNNYDITLVASMKNFTIPYGTCELTGEGYLKHINEKPEYDFLVNTGLYVLNPDVLSIIPEGKLYHITHLIEDIKNQGKRVGVYPISDDAWIDVGQWAEYQNAVERL